MGLEEDIKKFNKFADLVEQSCPALAIYFEESVNLSDEDFADYYLSLMETYKITEDWWIEDNNPLCSECGEEIVGPKDLRMYESNPYHPACFSEMFEREGKAESELMKRFWGRVLALDF